MRVRVEIDDKLMADALALSGLSSTQEVVELGLKTLLRLVKQEEIRQFRGKLSWRSSLDDSRLD